MIEINKLEPHQSELIAQLHKQFLSSPLVGNSGCKLLGAYYEILARNEGGVGYIAVENDEIAGYICGIWDSKRITLNLVKYRFIKILGLGFQQVFAHPRMLLDFTSRIFSLLTPGCSGYELRPIVISPDHRGTGIASVLVNKLVNDALRRGFHEIFLFVDKDNIAATKFYKKMGFELKIPEVKKGHNLVQYILICN